MKKQQQKNKKQIHYCSLFSILTLINKNSTQCSALLLICFCFLTNMIKTESNVWDDWLIDGKKKYILLR